jgi:hypothetical protein
MKNYVGRKIRGFRFDDGTDDIRWNEDMFYYLGKVGNVVKQGIESVTVKFDCETWTYPISLIEPHLIEDKAPEIIDLTNVDGLLMEVSDDSEIWVTRKIIANYWKGSLDSNGHFWLNARPIQQLPKYTHAELVEKLGHDFEIIK